MEKNKVIRKKEKTPHEVFFIATLRIPVLARDFFKAHISPETIKDLDLESFVLVDNLLKKGEEEPPYASVIYEGYTKAGVRVYVYVMLGDPREDPYFLKHVEDYSARLALRYNEEGNKGVPVIYHCALVM
jgi:hypothetical protein